jgi:hypothetical protein
MSRCSYAWTREVTTQNGPQAAPHKRLSYVPRPVLRLSVDVRGRLGCIQRMPLDQMDPWIRQPILPSTLTLCI